LDTFLQNFSDQQLEILGERELDEHETAIALSTKPQARAVAKKFKYLQIISTESAYGRLTVTVWRNIASVLPWSRPKRCVHAVLVSIPSPILSIDSETELTF